MVVVEEVYVSLVVVVAVEEALLGVGMVFEVFHIRILLSVLLAVS